MLAGAASCTICMLCIFELSRALLLCMHYAAHHEYEYDGASSWFLILTTDGRVVRASVSVAVDLDLIMSQIKPMTLKLVFTASLLDAQH